MNLIRLFRGGVQSYTSQTSSPEIFRSTKLLEVLEEFAKTGYMKNGMSIAMNTGSEIEFKVPLLWK